MVGPIAYNGQAQIPAANTFQPGGQQSGQSRIQEDNTEQTRPTGTSAAQTQQAETRNNGSEREASIVQSNSNEDNGAAAQNTQRGATLDISV